MALRVPTVDGPSVGEQGLPSAYQRSSASPALLSEPGRQLQALGQAGLDLHLQMQDRQDADEIMRAETQVKGDYLAWEGDAKQRKGQQAWGITKEAGDWWDKNGAKALENVTSPRAKKLMQQEIMKQRATAVGAFSGFEAGQRRASLDESAQASIVGSINMAAANPQNPEIVGGAKADILKRNALRAQVNGWSPEMADAKRTEYLTNLHKQVIQGLVRDQPEAAEAYFNANKGEIEGSQHAEVGAFAAKATATRMGETQADAVWQQLGPKGDRDPVQLDVLEESMRKSSLGDEAKKVGIAHLKERAAAFKDARKERDEQLEASVNLAVLKGASGSQIRNMPEFLRMDGEKQRRIVDFIETRALRSEQRAAAQESRAATAEVREQSRLTRQGTAAYLVYSSPDTLNGMSEAQVVNLLPSLGNELTMHLMQQKRALAANPGKLAEARMDDDDFKQVAQEMGLRPFAAKTEEEKADLGALKYRAEQMIASTQQAGGKPLARDQKLTLLRQELAKTVTVGGFFSNDTVPVIGLTPAQAAKVVVPRADREQIAEALRQKYTQTPKPEYEPTDANVRRLYLRGKSRAASLIPDAK